VKNGGKKRADILLAEKGLADSRETAKRMIMAGQVYQVLNEQKIRVDKPGRFLSQDTLFFVETGSRFVSRGGEKLLTAIEEFDIQVKDKVCLDVGASTGGFTDCLLQMGAARVYALDVGAGQLHWKLRNDPRVIILEKINIRRAKPSLLPEKVDLAAIDCSFISLTLVLPAVTVFLKHNAQVVALVKPQFEVGRGRTVKGVVRSEKDAEQAVQKVIDLAVQELDLKFLGRVPSRIKGPKGNQEHLIYLCCVQQPGMDNEHQLQNQQAQTKD